MRVRRGSIIAGLSVLLVGCSALTTFDGLMGDGDSSDGGKPDATSAVADGSMMPSSDDGATPNMNMDGSSSDAGVTDSPTGMDGSVSGYCPNHPGHTFCDDFDLFTTLGIRWQTHSVTGTVAVGSFDYNSPPRSVVAMTPDTDGGQDGENDIEKSFNTTKTMDIEAAIKVATLNGATYLGRADKVGSIALGKQADLVVLDGDPSARIDDIRKVSMVFKEGIGYDPAKLIASVRGKVGLF